MAPLDRNSASWRTAAENGGAPGGADFGGPRVGGAEDVGDLIENALERAVRATRSASGPLKLGLAVRHAVFAGGARVRPKLCLAVARAGGPGRGADAIALGAGVAIELLHCASLVHDDLPCFDNADVRRGAPSVHRAYGEPLAVLAGDALIVMAFQALLRECAHAPDIFTDLTKILVDAAGAPAGIVAGQAWESEEAIDVRAYHRSKTGALFVAACESGAVCAGADPADWRLLGVRLGEAYQIADDIRDVVCAEEELGKPTGADGVNGQPNSVNILGLEGAAEQLHELMRDAVDSVPDCPGADVLRALVLAQAERLIDLTTTRETSGRRA